MYIIKALIKHQIPILFVRIVVIISRASLKYSQKDGFVRSMTAIINEWLISVNAGLAD